MGPKGELASGYKTLSSDSEITTGGSPITTEDHEASTVQHRRFFGYGSTAYSRGIRKMSESKLKSIIEDILSDKGENNDLVSKENNLDSKMNKFLKSIKAEVEELGSDEIIKKLRDKFNK